MIDYECFYFLSVVDLGAAEGPYRLKTLRVCLPRARKWPAKELVEVHLSMHHFLRMYMSAGVGVSGGRL
jgi:hypothetical protein